MKDRVIHPSDRGIPNFPQDCYFKWPVKQLKDVCTVNYGKTLKKENRIHGKIPVYGTNGITGWHNESLFDGKSIIIGRVGAGPLGVYWQNGPFWVIDCGYYVRIDENTFNPMFFYYFMKYVGVNHLKDGAAKPTLNRNNLYNQYIVNPPLNNQNVIVSIFSAYDNLIENNARRIQILEEMAQRIYKEWFVDFKYPGYENDKLVESELGMIPEGWEVVEVSNLLKRLKAGNKYTKNNVSEKGLIPVIDQSEKEILGYHDNEPDQLATAHEPIIIFGDHTCKMQLLVKPFSIGPNVIPFISKINYPIYFLYYLVNSLVETREYKRHWNDLIDKIVIIPKIALSDNFSGIVNPLFQQISGLKKLNENLRQTRDLLLPKLISGKVDVSNMDIDTSILND